MSPAASGSASVSAVAHPYAAHVADASHRFGIPETWIWAVMRAESSGRSLAVSHAGAMGLMQIMPRTWRILDARYGLGPDPFDVRANILGGAAYLRLMWDRYGDVALMLAAYNAGPGRVDEYRAGLRRLPAETSRYVARIAPSLGASAALSNARLSASPSHPLRPKSVFAVIRNVTGTTVGAAEDLQSTEVLTANSDALPRQFGTAADQLFVPLSARQP
ncbi:lytic transglycosylase domain-containing protein [Blastomonas fulva]|uniref:lytic transglycosylase domain-containing protein n=1 Tax=Blastomonas fulva TaxID=1550728 RepID=UPI003F6E4AEC